MSDRNPLTIGYDTNNNANKLIEISFSSTDLADVADVLPLENQVLVFSGGIYAPSTLSLGAGGGGTSFTCTDLSSCDHGILAGLGDDDHTQYVLSDGTRPMASLVVDNALRAGSVSSLSISAVALNATNASALNLTGTNLHITNLGASSLTGTTITASNVNAITEVSSASLRGTTTRWTNATGTNASITNLTAGDIVANTLAGSEEGLAITATTVGAVTSLSSASVTGTNGTFTNLTGINTSVSTATVENLTVIGTAPSSTISPTLAGHLTTKTYVDTVDAAIIAGSVLKAIPVTISAKHTATGGISFTTVAPESTVTPAAGNDLTNKTYVDSRTGAPMTVLAIGSGTADVDGVEHDMHWKVPAISDANITFAATEGSSITFATAGTYQLDVAARLNGGSSGYNRLQGTIMTYKYNADTSSWVKLTDHTSDCYVTRDSTTGPFGSLNLNTMLALTAGDKIKFSVSANSLGSQCDMTEEGTILRIVGWS